MDKKDVRGGKKMKKIDYSKIQVVCFDCAKKAGFTPKNKVVGVWTDKCGICHKWKPSTNLWHDWKPTKKSEVSNDKNN